jgi:hypothetical protein
MDSVFRDAHRAEGFDIYQTRWWTTAYAYLAFVPRFPAFNDPPFDCLKIISIDKYDEGFILGSSIGARWARLEEDLDRAIDILRHRYDIALVRPFRPSSWLYRYFWPHRIARERAMRSRDWIVIWMAMFSYSVAVATTKSLDTPFDSKFAVPGWYTALYEGGIDEIWISTINMSSAVDFYRTERVGLYVDIVNTETNQPSIEWFCRCNVPVWYLWNQREIDAIETMPWLSNYAPASHLLQEAGTIITKLPSVQQSPESPEAPGLPEAPESSQAPQAPQAPPTQSWREFLDARKRRNDRMIQFETPKEKQRRLDRLKNPPIAGAKMFRWEDKGNVPRVLIREAVRQAYREDVYHEFGVRQRIYDPISNEWDLCEEFGPPDDDEGDDEYDDDEGYPEPIPAPIEADIDFQPPPREPSPPPLPITEDQLVEDTPEIYEISQILGDYYGFVRPSDIPAEVETITPEQRKTVLRALGMARDDDDIFNTRVGKSVNDFVMKLSSKTHPDPSCWDLSRTNRRALARCSDRLKCIRRVADDLWLFDFGEHATVPWKIAVTTVADVLTVCRIDPKARDMAIAQELLKRGIRFRTLHPLRPIPGPVPKQELMIPYRLSGYRFTTRDYDAYLRQRTRILTGPRGRAALLRGGFVWRLAMQTMGLGDVLKGPSPDVLVRREGFSVSNLWDDELTETELDLICGTYICFTGMYYILLHELLIQCFRRQRDSDLYSILVAEGAHV